MNKFENNAYFWQKVDTLCLSGDFVLKNVKGSVDVHYHNLVFPCDFGYLQDSSKNEVTSIACFKGSKGLQCESCIVSVDILKGSLNVMLLLGVSDQEEDEILRFLNQTDFQKTVLIRKGNEIPNWSWSE